MPIKSYDVLSDSGWRLGGLNCYNSQDTVSLGGNEILHLKYVKIPSSTKVTVEIVG